MHRKHKKFKTSNNSVPIGVTKGLLKLIAMLKKYVWTCKNPLKYFKLYNNFYQCILYDSR